MRSIGRGRLAATIARCLVPGIIGSLGRALFSTWRRERAGWNECDVAVHTMAPPSHGRLNGDVLNFLRRAHRVLGEDKEEPSGPDAAAMRHEVVQTIVDQLAGPEETPAAATHVFGSVALARVLAAADGAQRVALATPLLDHPDPVSLIVDK